MDRGVCMKPKKSIPKLKKEVWEVFSRYIRLRDALRTTGTQDYVACISCGKVIPTSESQAGHFISRRHGATLFDETNVHAQCVRCNVFLHGNLLDYRTQLNKLYGDNYDVILKERGATAKRFTKEELNKLKEEYKQKIKEVI
jgi:5-methylcytosine-specific restriction endonuclease McrA